DGIGAGRVPGASRRDRSHGREGCVGGQTSRDALPDHGLGGLRGAADVRALGELGRDGGGEGAACAADALLADLRGAQDGDVLAVEVYVHGVGSGQLGATLGDDVARAQLVDTAGGFDQVVDGVDALH